VISVILAAGAGRRLGGVAKALLEREDGCTFLEAIARTGRRAGVVAEVVVVAEPHRSVVVAEAERLGLPWVCNPEPERGMGSSVELGFAHALARHGDVAAGLLWPVDHPFVRWDTVARLRAALGAKAAVIPTVDGRGGHPVLVARQLWAPLSRCAAMPRGAQTVLRERGSEVLRIEVGDRDVVSDVDWPADTRARAGAR